MRKQRYKALFKLNVIINLFHCILLELIVAQRKQTNQKNYIYSCHRNYRAHGKPDVCLKSITHEDRFRSSKNKIKMETLKIQKLKLKRVTETPSIINYKCTWESSKILKVGKKDGFNNNNRSEYYSDENCILINNSS